MAERRFATISVSLGADTVGRITQFGESITVSEEMISGSEDATSGDNAIVEKYIPVSVGQTANCGGVSLITDDGQAAVKAAAEDATEDLVLEFRYADGSGTDYTGFFTNYENTGELSANVFRFTAQFRVNSKTDVPAT